MSDWILSEHERIIANLIRIGTVSAVDVSTACVKVKIGDVETDWVQWATVRAGSTRTWSCPSVGEQVMVFCPFGDLAQAIPALSLYQDTHPAPANDASVDRAAFADGSTVDYNSVSNTLTVNVSGAGNVILNSANVTVNASNQVTLNTPHTICKGQLTVEGAFTYLAGMVGSGGGANSAQITGGVAFSGGELIHNGKNIGATHTHGNVQNGNGSTSPPL